MKTTIQSQVLEKLKGIFSFENPKILIIEDHSEAAKLQSIIILRENKNAVVTIAYSYENAVRLLERNYYDIVLLDNALDKWKDASGRLGTEFIPLIRKRNPQGFILFTSMNLAVSEELVRKNKVDFYIDKGNLFELFKDLERVGV